MPKGDRPAETLARSDVSALLAKCPPRSLTGLRNRALIIVMWRAGLRCAEALALRNADFDPATGGIRVLKPKGVSRRKSPALPRTVYLDPEAGAVVQAWIRAKREAGLTAQALFVYTHGKTKGKTMATENGARNVRMIFADLGRRAGVGKRVRPHMLRHTFAAENDLEGTSVTVIKKALGHRSLATTEIYLDHLSASDVAAAMRSRPPWGAQTPQAE